MFESFFALGHLVAIGICVALGVVDIREHRLPNRLVLLLLGCAVATGVLGLFAGASSDHVGNAVIGAIAFGGPCLILNLISPRLMGFGDVKLAFVLGLFIGWHNPWAGLSALFGAFVLSMPQAIYRMLADRRGGSLGREIAFGPYLIVAAAIAVAFNYVALPVAT